MWGIAFRQLLGRFLDVCDAIDYAHSRGVLHRDLKPANIMLGHYGETLVVDWGLAKMIGTADILPTANDDDFEPSLASGPDSRAHATSTQPGTTIGTPAYMSPEQARGDIDDLGPTSDVYSLGATLYELITGRVAFPGDQVLEVIERVRRAAFRPPRSVQRTLPAPLEAICLKAMALRPEDRYASVRELARDLEHWLADEPVSAYREGRLERAGRWLRHHRTWTYAAGAALIGIALAATIGAVFIERGRRREADARAGPAEFPDGQPGGPRLPDQRQREHPAQAAGLGRPRDLRRELLSSALVYYKEFVRQQGGDLQLRRELAEAHFHLGEIASEIGTVAESIAAFEAARSVRMELLAAAPDDPEIRAQVAECQMAIGSRLADDSQFSAARTAYEAARELLLPMTRRHADVAAYQVDLAECDRMLGQIQSVLGSPDQGLEPLDRCTNLLKSWLAHHPGDSRFLRKLADALTTRGFVNYRRRDLEAAIGNFREVLRISEEMLAGVTSGPRPIHLLDRLALAHYNIATVHMELAQPMAGLEEMERSLSYRQALATAHPSVLHYQWNLAQSLSEIALLQHRTRQDARALVTIERSIDVLERLVRDWPADSRFRAALGRSWNIKGFLHDEARQNLRALPALERTAREATRAMNEAPEMDLYRSDAINTLSNLAEQFIDLGRPAEGFPVYRRANALRQLRLEAQPGDRAVILDLAEGLFNLCDHPASRRRMARGARRRLPAPAR